MQEQFTKYEIARILGARALQIAMDAPLLLKISDDDLKAMKYDAIKIAQREIDESVLPISINRPVPKKRKDKLKEIKEETVSDEEIVAKEHQVEKEIVEDPDEYSLVGEAEEITELETPGTEEA